MMKMVIPSVFVLTVLVWLSTLSAQTPVPVPDTPKFPIMPRPDPYSADGAGSSAFDVVFPDGAKYSIFGSTIPNPKGTGGPNRVVYTGWMPVAGESWNFSTKEKSYRPAPGALWTEDWAQCGGPTGKTFRYRYFRYETENDRSYENFIGDSFQIWGRDNSRRVDVDADGTILYGRVATPAYFVFMLSTADKDVKSYSSLFRGSDHGDALCWKDKNGNVEVLSGPNKTK